MQSVQTLLDDLKQQDINLYIEGDRLRCNAPKEKLTPSLQARLKERKSEILDFLRRQMAIEAIAPQPELRHHPFPLTDIQQAYWLGRQDGLELGGISAHIYWEIETRGIAVAELERAWQCLIDRHDMLRAVIAEDGQQQILENTPLYQIPVVDLQGETATTQTTKLEKIRQELSHQVFQSDRWPLFELQAARLDSQTVRFCFSFDLILGDAWSVKILMAELAHFLRQPTRALPPLTLSFRDCVLAEREARKSDRYQRDREYWQNRLETLPPPPEIPLKNNPATLVNPQFTRRRRQLSPEDWQRLKRRASQAQLTPSGVLLAAFAEVVATWSKNPHFTLNLTLVNRPPLHREIGQIVGDFTSITLLEANCTGEEAFVTRSQRLQKQLWLDLDRQTYSGVQVLRELARRSQRRSAALMPIVFTSMLGLGQADREKNDLLQGLGQFVYMISQTPQVYLDSQISEDAGSLVICWDSVEGLFPPGLLDEMFAAYGDFLQRLADEEEVWMATERSLLPSEQREYLAAFNNTNTELPGSDELLHTLFFQQAIAQPEQVAVIAGDRMLTYGELRALVLTLARQLREKGAKPNELLAVVMERGWEQVVATLAILTAGAAYVPIDPELPEERRSHIMAEAGICGILTQSKFEDSLHWPENLERFWVDAIVPDPSCPMLEPQQTVTDLAYVIYTSGSTGKPKGVAIEHRGAVNTILDINQRFGVTAKDRVLAVSSLSFDLSVYDIFGILAAGGTIVAIAPGASKDPSNWAELVCTHGITLWNSVPALMQMLLDYTASRSDFDLSSLRLILLSGDWIPLTLPDRIQAATGGRVISLGGATEASIWSIFYPIETVDPTWKSIPYGRPLGNQQFYVLDENLESRPVWIPGQLYIGGIGLAREYWRNEEKSAGSFIRHLKTGERLYKTGDLGRYLPDGNIEFLGREDFQVKINGYRIELGEIESALLQHPAVKEAVILAVGDSQENKHLASYIVPKNEETFNPIEENRELWETLVEAGTARSQTRNWNLERAIFEQLWDEQNQRYLLSVCLAFNRLGIYQSQGETYTVEEILSQSGIIPRYRKWLARALQELAKAGLLQEEGDRFTNIAPLWEAAQSRYLTNLDDRETSDTWLDLLPREPDEVLADILIETIHSAELYASNTTLNVYGEIFADCNAIATGIVEYFVKSFDGDRPIRILEIGAGYGTTAAHLLPLLPGDRATYYFTDISQFFLQKARERFGDYPFVRYDILDIEKSPQQQGFNLHEFDLIIAGTVLHNTRNLKETLDWTRSLLAPNGLLLAIEKTRFHPWFDLNMGLQQGFERFEDLELRSTHPVLSKAQWQTLLAQQGFKESLFFNPDRSIRDRIGFDVFLARNSPSATSFNPHVLRDYLSQKLPAYMVPSSYTCLDAIPLTSNGKLDRKQLPKPDIESERSTREYVEPHTETEKLLARIWSEILQVDTIGIHDNFFEIGGDSLLNIQIVARGNEFHLELKPQYIFQFPTIAELAAFLDQSSSDTEEVNFNPLIPIKPSGSKNPLFCIHSSTGSGSSFIEMARYFDSERPLYGLQSRGFNGELSPLSTIEEMASTYIQAIQTVQPEGPYYLCGWSMGGIVAFEMARQLQENNLQVEFLGLIDIMADDRDRQLELLSQAHPNGDINLQDISLDLQKNITNLSKTNTNAMLLYTLQQYTGNATLFKAREQPERIPDSVNFGWSQYILGELEIQEIPGNHFSMMRSPHVKILSQKICDRL
ncbi:non-ribosomal peptide synthetase [Roseofilum casamattae]|uniref:Amino acid adenylation domain-containing protein n=1 Tax=Roseofilum casamattae BLCC-M143 TaxID=3022442 RepID=A0ABT7BYF3_9CYAN|nr:non-ribosomal peptide synthetase [Roseofilum casamattae]MDJ1184233.1 amino acid adenylation domain-containing protein [Roseofilum casamattae BLCC-M143]